MTIKDNDLAILATVNGFKIAEHPTLGEDHETLIKVDGEWFTTDDYDVPDIDDVKWLVSEIRMGGGELVIDLNGTVVPF